MNLKTKVENLNMEQSFFSMAFTELYYNAISLLPHEQNRERRKKKEKILGNNQQYLFFNKRKRKKKENNFDHSFCNLFTEIAGTAIILPHL